MQPADAVVTSTALSRGERVVLALAPIVVVGVAMVFWLPLTATGNTSSTIRDVAGWRSLFVASAVVPAALLAIAGLALRRNPRLAQLGGLSAAVMATLPITGIVATTTWRRANPGIAGPPFEYRHGFFVATVVGLLGMVIFAAVIVAFLDTDEADDAADMDGRSVPIVGGPATVTVAAGTAVAVAGHVMLSDSDHLWELPGLMQVGPWWHIVVTTGLSALVVWRRTLPAVAAAVPVAVTAVALAWQRLDVLGAVTQTRTAARVTLAGYTVVAVALGATLVALLTAAPNRRARVR